MDTHHHSFKKTILVLLITLSFLVLVWRFVWPTFLSMVNLGQKSGIKVLSTPEKATVYINNQKKGETPYEETDLMSGDYLVRLDSVGNSWQGQVSLTPGTLTVLNRELGKTGGSGEMLALADGRGVTIVTTPTRAQVEIDGQPIGETPLKRDLPPGEHTFIITHDHYNKKTIRANVPQKFSLILSVDLELMAANLPAPATPAPKAAVVLKVKTTPTGFLRVRDKPSLAGVEIGRINSGEELELLEEGASWDKIKTSGGLEGYVFVTYVEKR